MGIRTRYFLLEEGGALKRVARRIVEGLTFGTDAIPEYAGTKQRVIQVLVEIQGGKPVRILDVTGTFWTFDQDGKIDENLRRTTGDWMDFHFSVNSRNNTRGKVVDLVPELKRKELHARDRWTVSQEDVDRISVDLWPGINGPAPDVTAVKGQAPPNPPLTREGRQALSEIGSKVAGIDFELQKLSEAALRGFAFEAERYGTFEDQALWRGIAEHAKHRRAILVTRRTGRGTWYAVIEARKTESPLIIRTVGEAYAQGKNRAEAIAAGRRLLVEKADWLGPDIELNVSLYSALEWQPEED